MSDGLLPSAQLQQLVLLLPLPLGDAGGEGFALCRRALQLPLEPAIDDEQRAEGSLHRSRAHAPPLLHPGYHGPQRGVFCHEPQPLLLQRSAAQRGGLHAAQEGGQEALPAAAGRQAQALQLRSFAVVVAAATAVRRLLCVVAKV